MRLLLDDGSPPAGAAPPPPPALTNSGNNGAFIASKAGAGLFGVLEALQLVHSRVSLGNNLHGNAPALEADACLERAPRLPQLSRLHLPVSARVQCCTSASWPSCSRGASPAGASCGTARGSGGAASASRPAARAALATAALQVSRLYG